MMKQNMLTLLIMSSCAYALPGQAADAIPFSCQALDMQTQTPITHAAPASSFLLKITPATTVNLVGKNFDLSGKITGNNVGVVNDMINELGGILTVPSVSRSVRMNGTNLVYQGTPIIKTIKLPKKIVYGKLILTLKLDVPGVGGGTCNTSIAVP